MRATLVDPRSVGRATLVQDGHAVFHNRCAAHGSQAIRSTQHVRRWTVKTKRPELTVKSQSVTANSPTAIFYCNAIVGDSELATAVYQGPAHGDHDDAGCAAEWANVTVPARVLSDP